MADLAISCRGLSKTYRLGFRARKVAALADLDLAVAPGSVYGFVGPNGAGKTTTIKVLVGLVRASAGQAALFGRDVADHRARLSVGYLPENPSFHDFMRPLDVLRYLGRLSGLGGADLERRAGALLERVGLAHARDLTVRKFSKGMVQRLGLAQALVHDPPLLVLDEPMSGLDPIGRKEVRDLILELGRAGKTIFFSTHILSDVETICDRVGMLLRGRLVREGPLGSLLDVTVPAGVAFEHAVHASHTVLAYVFEGEGRFGGDEAPVQRDGQLAILTGGETVRATASGVPMRFLLAAGKPLREPVAWAGPIVMNTDEELAQAFREYREGTFVKAAKTVS
jgi:ABC-2 type transport system ATP-binding protein